MKQVACYCRVSTEEQAKYGFSIEAQKDALEKYCKKNKYKYEFFIDEGISASSMKKRNALNDMLKRSKDFDIVLFTKLDRLSRNVLDANTINKILQDNNCNMKAIDEDDIDTSTADGMFMFNLRVSLAQREIGKTSERIKFVFKNKREKGEVTSGTKKYGYNIVDRKFVINEQEAENLRNLYKFFIDSAGNYQETYKYFIKHFSSGSDALYAYLRDTAYIGKYKLYRKEEYIDGYCPRIIDDDLFYSVQNLLRKKEKTSKRTTSISLFSNIVQCNVCRKTMCKKQDNRVKSRLIRYGCDNANKYKVNSLEKKCSNNRLIRETEIEEYLLKNIKQLALNHIANNEIKRIDPVKDNSSQIKKLENKIEKIKDLYLEDLISKEDYTKDYKSMKSELEKLKTINDIPKKDFSKLKSIINNNIEEIYPKLSIEEKRFFWVSIIDKIYIENAEIKRVTFL